MEKLSQRTKQTNDFKKEGLKIMKKLICTILAMAMIVSTMGTVVFANGTDIDVTNNAELATAIANAVDGATIKLAAGEYSAFNVSGKKITVEGTLGADGEHLTVIKGGNPAITGHNFDGTIKNLKIADAFKAFYGEPCGNIVFDNLYVTGATYGIHAVAYENGKEWTIQNCYMNISWANSFGRYTGENATEETEGATIIIKNNEFESTSPYYPDYGAPIINTSSPYTVVEDNSIGKNVKIQFLNQDAATGTEIGLNYYADGAENVIVSDNEYDVPPIAAWYETEDMDEDKVAVNKIFVAKVGDTYYTTLQDALKAITAENNVVEIVNDVTITEDWDCRNSGAKITVPVTINGNGHTLKFTGEVDDKNWFTVFRFEDDATVKNLTIDASEATVIQRGISAKGNITVEDFTFIGNGSSAKYGVIFGEGSGENIGNITATITGSSFENCSYGVSDNRNEQDVKAVTVSESTFTNAKVLLSAKETLTFTNNKVTGGSVTITSYSDVTELTVTATGNALDETATNYIEANEINTDSDVFDLPVADIAGKKYVSLASAANAVVAGETATITITGNVSDENVTINGNVTLVNGVVSTYALGSNATTLNNVIFTVENGASLSLDGFAVRGLSYIYAKTPDSISVTNCDIDVTTVEVSGTNCPPGFVLFSSNNDGSVEFTFTNNTLLAAPDATEDWYTYSHGIAGWNSIESATITGNTFGSAESPLGAAAVKLMNFVDGAAVEVSNNTIYVNSQDSTYGPNALQLYQNNSRDNSYTAAINGNKFYVDTKTAAVGVNVNAMGTPDTHTGGAQVVIGEDNTVNGDVIGISDVLVFGNSINDIGYTRSYVGVGVEYDADGKIIGGTFNPNSLGLEAATADGFQIFKNSSGNYYVEDGAERADAISVVFKDVTKADEKESKTYEIVLKANDGDEIHELASADLNFALSAMANPADAAMDITVLPAAGFTLSRPATIGEGEENRYMFNYSGIGEAYEGTANAIPIGTITVNGYGTYSISTKDVTTNIVNATTLQDNLVDSFTAEGGEDDDLTTGELIINKGIDNELVGKVEDGEITVPTYALNIEIDFPNTVNDNAAAYQNMTVSIVGGKINKEIKLGTTPEQTEDDYTATITTGTADAAEYAISVNLPYNTTYTVTVEGAGYRTARHSVALTEAKTLKFWNNVKDNAEAIEAGKNEMTKNFLAGEIVKDNKINVYDLSAVVSYFGQVDLNNTESANYNTDYAKYDLNRDGKIDSLDVAYVLVSWGE